MSQPQTVAGKDLVGPLPLGDEEYREYEWEVESGRTRVYRIDRPKSLYYRTGGTTHRVVDSNGVTHTVPTVGEKGCVLRWKASPEVSF